MAKIFFARRVIFEPRVNNSEGNVSRNSFGAAATVQASVGAQVCQSLDESVIVIFGAIAVFVSRRSCRRQINFRSHNIGITKSYLSGFVITPIVIEERTDIVCLLFVFLLALVLALFFILVVLACLIYFVGLLGILDCVFLEAVRCSSYRSSTVFHRERRNKRICAFSSSVTARASSSDRAMFAKLVDLLALLLLSKLFYQSLKRFLESSNI